MHTIIETRPTELAPAPTSTTKRRLPYPACVTLACVLMFANYLGAMPLLLVTPLVPTSGPGAQLLGTVVNSAACVLTLLTAIGLVWFVSRRVLGRTLAEIGFVFTRSSGWIFLVGWAVAALGTLTAQIVTPLIGFDTRTPIPPEAWAKLTVGVVVISVIGRVFQALALQGIPEELVFRGWLMNCLVERPRLSLAVSSISFGLLHIISKGGQDGLVDHLVYLLPAAAFGFVGGALALRLRSLWAAFGVHAGFHLTNTVLQFTSLNGDGAPIWIAQMIVWVLVGLIVLRSWKGIRVAYVR